MENTEENNKTLINQEIDKPSHYTTKEGRDYIEIAEELGWTDNAYIFNIGKYLYRKGKKKDNSELQDAMKAAVYLKRYIEKLRKSAQ